MPKKCFKGKILNFLQKKNNASSRVNASEDKSIMMKNFMHDRLNLSFKDDFLNSKHAAGHV